MKPIIIKPRHPILKKHVEYFLFFKKADNTNLRYTTFPNNNLCLALYKQNQISYTSNAEKNNCIIKNGNYNYVSRFYGFHKMPFQVDINAALDQICILFYPGALRMFTAESYKNIMTSNHVFEEIFSLRGINSLEEIFEENDFLKRAQKLELLLVKKLNYQIPEKLNQALYFISISKQEFLSVDALAKKLDISPSTLFRLFKNHLGQNPKTYLNTVRFRHVLNQVLQNKKPVLDTNYLSLYHDQAHLIRDFKIFSGFAPKVFSTKASVENNELTWIYKPE